MATPHNMTAPTIKRSATVPTENQIMAVRTVLLLPSVASSSVMTSVVGVVIGVVVFVVAFVVSGSFIVVMGNAVGVELVNFTPVTMVIFLKASGPNAHLVNGAVKSNVV